jgi:hypothetical protein
MLAIALAGCGGGGADRTRPLVLVKRFEKGPALLVQRVGAERITVADRVEMTLEATAEEGREIRFPEAADKLGEFTVAGVRTEPPQLVEGDRVRLRRTYELEPFLAGDYEIPALAVGFGPGVELRTEPVKVRVDSVLPESPGRPELKEIVPPVGLPGFPAWGYGGVALALAAAAGWLLWRRWKRARRRAERPPLPHEIALRALRELMEQDLIGRGEAKLFYLRLSSILRHYIEDRFALRAPERTTEEFLRECGGTDLLSGRQVELLREFLLHCDLVKFAGYQPSRAEIDATINACAQFIAETRPQDEAVETVTAPGGC